jgi:ribosomal protein L1
MLDLAEGLAAVMALREDQARAVEAGLDQLGMDEIEEEIRKARKALKHRKRSA